MSIFEIVDLVGTPFLVPIDFSIRSIALGTKTAGDTWKKEGHKKKKVNPLHNFRLNIHEKGAPVRGIPRRVGSQP